VKRETILKPIGRAGTPVEVLLVEDGPGDVRLTHEAFLEANPTIHLRVACDGVEALAFLRREGEHARALRPDLILLDLNLPRMDGHVKSINEFWLTKAKLPPQLLST
jgi:DNA-binding response OmpR family regulator